MTLYEKFKEKLKSMLLKQSPSEIVFNNTKYDLDAFNLGLEESSLQRRNPDIGYKEKVLDE